MDCGGAATRPWNPTLQKTKRGAPTGIFYLVLQRDGAGFVYTGGVLLGAHAGHALASALIRKSNRDLMSMTRLVFAVSMTVLRIQPSVSSGRFDIAT